MKGKKDSIKVLIAKLGLDGHDRGAKALAFSLRNEGMTVIYTGIKQTAESVVETALQEDVDVVGLSSLSGVHMHYFPQVVELLAEKGLNDVLVIGGGIIPEADVVILKEKGIKEIFGPGSRTDDIASFIRTNLKKHRD